MINYAASAPAGTANTTSANAGIIAAYGPLTAPGGGSKIYEWEIGPGANSADNTYAVRFRRNTTLSTWNTAITPAAVQPAGNAFPTALTLSGANSTARGTLTAGNVGSWGFHMRGGYRWVAVPGAELQIAYAVNNGLELEYFFAQGTDVLEPCLFFAE